MGESHFRKPTETAEGTVKSFDDGTGNGIIARQGDTDVFVNRSAIRGDGLRTLVLGARVRVEVMEGPNGPRAASLRRI
ncbi:MAG: cold-shock protein [candidate division Zixibacteria bacterium]|nr:cold-shock protein [candidate division Zixibacteria bacterium]